MRIILGMTGSVASVLHKKLVTELQSIGDVDVVLTDKASPFIDMPSLCDALEQRPNNFLYMDCDEWKWKGEGAICATIDGIPMSRPMSYSKSKWEKGDKVLHIDLRDNAGVLVIAPCSANTLAKLANGLTDNLLTSVARAWDMTRLKVIAPSMNTYMWEHPVTQEHISKLESWGWIVVPPQKKMLACNTLGMGAMANIEDIVNTIKENIRWSFPIWHGNCKGIPIGEHPGAFLTKRKHHTHTGVDLYVTPGMPFHAVEDGRVISVENFTGHSDSSPWWLDTKCVLIEGSTGVVCYGEVDPNVSVGQTVKQGEVLGIVIPVLPDNKFRPDIDGHSVAMLHLEMYPNGKKEAFRERGEVLDDWSILQDPTSRLINSSGAPERKFIHPKL